MKYVVWLILISGLLSMGAGTGALAQVATFDDEIRVTLLGTGTPVPLLSRFGPSTLVQAGGETLLFDCGRGATQRLWQLGIRFGSVDALFLTHLHSDHLVGLPDFWLMGWLNQPWGQRSKPLQIYGPEGTGDMVQNLRRAFAWDVDHRLADGKPGAVPSEATEMRASEFQGGVVYERNGVRVTAILVEHGGAIRPAYGFRIDYRGRSVVLSGDTEPNDNLIRYATGVDLLIHQVSMGLSNRTGPLQAGDVFNRANPKMAAYYHIALLASPGAAEPTEGDLERATRKVYGGPLVLGADLMQFRIGASGVSISVAEKVR